MAEFKLDRFKYVWKGEWISGTVYNRDDIVRVKGKTYVCLEGHTAESSFRTDLNAIVPGSSPPVPAPKWRVMTSSKSFRGVWNTSIDYDLGDILFYDGTLYTVIEEHTSTVFADNADKLSSFGDHIEFHPSWGAGVDYGAGAVVKYNGIVYRCITSHVSSSTLEENIDDWTVFHEGVEYRGTWQTLTEYRKNDLVKYGGSLFRVIETHVSSGEPSVSDADKFIVELPGYEYAGQWAIDVFYNVGDVVLWQGNSYIAKQNVIGIEPDENPGDSASIWELLAYSYSFQGNYSVDANYRPGAIVKRGGDLYLALQEIDAGDGSTNDFLDPTYWELFKPGNTWNNTWMVDTQYYPGDIVGYKGTAWVCMEQNLSTENNFPGDNGSGYDFWDVFIQAGIPAGMDTRGDLLTYGLSRSEAGDGSTLGLTNLGIGQHEELLSVTQEYDLFWRNLNQDTDVVYVGTHGRDRDGFGLNPEKPFRSVQYAADYIFWNYDPGTLVKLKVNTGRYYEVGPITVPAGTVVMGDELRSTTIEASDALPEYENDWDFGNEDLSHLRAIIVNVIQNIEIIPQEGNTLEQNTSLTPGTLASSTSFTSPIDAVKVWLNFRLADGDEDQELEGSNDITLSEDILNARAVVLANLDFLATDLSKYRLIQNPNADEEKVFNDSKAWVRSVAYDAVYPGNWRTIRTAEVYLNKIKGSRLEANMFLLRDTTGLRNCTVDGLEGRLNPPGVFELFQRPTGGAYCSLDPGWGGDDESVWITNRSPYIQGVTTLGSNAIGQKVDGALHNGGNKSFVSNDFTQVISDGIGAWVLNNGRAELVSVFTYYSQIGYLAENGGIMRTTNGNNSYGVYGSVSVGIDPDEIPQEATVDNTQNEALVDSAFAGEFQDEIFALEYAHCGENYTQARGQVIGAGANANIIYDDFFDGSIFQPRLLNEGSGAAGGSGYTVSGNNAQDGTTTSITIAQSDTSQPSEYIGKRIIITSGDGTGQYAIVNSLNTTTKIMNVIRESDGQPGWDHILPGTSINNTLSTNTVYRVEPRIEVTDPGFSVNYESLPSGRSWFDLTHGDTSAVYTELDATLGTGETDPTIDASVATFDVTRTGTEYTAALITGGAGYKAGDILTITGNLLGGATPANDLTIVVTKTTEDSTNAILGFTVEGVGLSGKFVAIGDPNFIAYSTDGTQWTETFLGEVGLWSKIATGNGKFVIMARNLDKVAVSSDGEEWNLVNLPINEFFSDITFGAGRFVIISENTNTVLVSTDAENWIQVSIPDDTIGDSTASQWQKVEYGGNRFIAVAGSDRAVAYSFNGLTWLRLDNALPAINYDFISVTYGKNRWLAIDKNGLTAQSLDNGLTWSPGTELPSQDGSTPMEWNSVKYLNGIWFGVCNTANRIMGEDPTDGTTTFCVTSDDGFYWKERNFDFPKNYQVVTYANINNIPTWFVLSQFQEVDGVAQVRTGAKAKMRAVVNGSQIGNIKIWDPGSGYVLNDNDPELIITDPTETAPLLYNLRLGNGVIGQPTFINRGVGYRTSSTRVLITGDGFADIIPESNFVVVKGVEIIPGPGAQLRFSSIFNLETIEDEEDLKIYSVSTIEDLGDDGNNAGTRLVRFRISPSLEIEDALETGTTVEIRERYSQCRITNHDFLDIGTGNFEQTNYPEIYAGGNFFTASPENEVFEDGGGRVFYVSTDQDGNFRAGELFSVEQATGIVTISAEFFDLDGLSELALGGVRLGGSGTVVREFSTDINFTEDSNNVVPTQRAVATFFENRLSQGGSEIATNNLQAGNVLVGSEINRIDIAGPDELLIPVIADFSGDKASIDGTMLANIFFLKSFDGA